MAEFSNVTVVKQANVYFDGKVTSRTLRFADGSVKTLGFMPELIELLSGELEVLLPGVTRWKVVQGGESFGVPGDSAFTVRVASPTDYCCSFLE